MDTAYKVKQLREAAGLSQTALAQKAGVSQGLIWKIESGETKDSSKLSKIAAALGVTTDSLAGDGPPRPLPVYAIKTDEDDPDEGDVTVEVADITLAAGDGSDMPEFVETKYKHTFRADWLRSMGVRRPESIKRCAIVGRSMEPTLWDRDVATINTEANQIADDEVYALVVGRKLKVKRLVWRRDGSLEIRSDNEDKDEYPTEIVPRDELHQVHIIGQVIDRSGVGGLKR